MSVNPQLLKNSTSVFLNLKAAIALQHGLDEDDQTVLDTVEGETDLDGLIAWAARQAVDRETQAEACGLQLERLRKRKVRHEAAAERIRAQIAQAMAESGLKAVKKADISIGVRLPKPAAKVVDASMLPGWATKTVTTVSPDSAAIKGFYERWLKIVEGLGENDPVPPFEVPGVAITNGAPILTIKTS